MAQPERPRRPQLIVTRRLPAQIEARMSELFDVELSENDLPLSARALAAAAARCDVLVPTITDHVDAAVIEAGKGRLKLIANFGNGVDHIDLKAARAAGIIVTNTPGVLTEDTADMTMALILSVPRRLAEGEKLVRSGNWTGWSPGSMLGHRIEGKQLGIIGMGRIGQAVAKRARAFDLSIAYHNRHRLPEVVEQELGARYEPDLDRLLTDSDIVSIHCPHTPETENLIDARRLSLLGQHVYLINTARGPIIDEEALIGRLERGEIAGAGLDVFAHEPAIDPRLLALDNVVLLPHMGSATFEGREASGERVILNIRQWADGHRPRDQVLEGWA
ncbi:2-hydroxyacid dehydrogenase [Rhizorhabdus dicambivorans]|uniref:D-glycerate dehydrogenase n=1 Tax=Rhizorhabdus dicambivorans TaxID=1850238 RepID=A0A2A4FUC0_9SPHN|nr:D-glycerate dehydrogenase [Rhizorhabdus dicambivorans]ATE64776.1 D-glycerate dehydrogenase [Rhizorhabdus dicambivorans]PCE41282.1 D-glycerate dehydrogenase [Rhizorhabdus dicambivorans]